LTAEGHFVAFAARLEHVFVSGKQLMKNRVFRWFAQAGMLGVLALLFAGCSSCKPGRPGPIGKYKIEVTLDDSLKSSSVLVDLTGVQSLSLPRWNDYDMAKYWREGDPMRRDADKKTLNFVSGQATTQSLEMTDAIWDKWKAKGVSHIAILADLPIAAASQPGNADPRRQILPLDQCSWPDKTKALKILVQRSGIVVLTASRSPK
jgi:hypothetical protein